MTMQSLMFRLLAYVQTLPERMREERGQTSVEWLAIGAVLVAVLGVLATTGAHPIANAISDTVQKIVKNVLNIK
jgi:hypothetical protein